jgi:tetratricopeptide (TPR) repeat protein
MDPIGTITAYFPFIDEETKNVLERTMIEASDFYDFVQKLGELVLKNDSPIMVVYFAIHNAILALDFPLIDMIRERYGEHQILGPNLFMSSAFQGSVEDIEKVHEMADAILATEPEDWIALEMNFMKFEADMRNYPKTIYKDSTMRRIRELIDSNPDFGFYETILHDYQAVRAHHDGDNEGRLNCINKGLQIAVEFDDRIRVAHLLIRKASLFKGKEARELLEQAYEIVNSSLGIPVNFADIIYYLSLLDFTRGDFDKAIKQLLKSASIRERASLNTGNASLLLSILYNIIGEPESAYDWGRMAEDQFRSRPYMINRGVLIQIWSLILMGKITEAQILLETTRESILKSGDEMQLAWLYFVTGVMEMENGDFSLASSSIEQALRIYENFHWGTPYATTFLQYLAKIEVYSTDSGDTLTPSLAILEDKAISENWPGVQGQVLLLKAELAILATDEPQLREIIQQLRKLIESENLSFLKDPYERLLRKL